MTSRKILPRNFMRTFSAFLLFLFAGGIVAAPAMAMLSAREKRGKRIYLQGVTASGADIPAFLEDSGLEVTASVLPCVNCHDYNGRGKPEGGIVPSDITWEALTRPYGVKMASGRRRPPYSGQSLRMAIVSGIDPAGNVLLDAMPRYRFLRDDLEDLIAYLKVIARDHDPGMSAQRLTIGTVVPASPAMREMGEAIAAVQSAYWEDVNRRGGIYGRTIDLRIARVRQPGPEAVVAAARELVDRDQAFALEGAFIAGADDAVARYAQEQEVPLIGPFTLTPRPEFPLNRYVFYLFSGIETESRILIDFLENRLRYEAPRVVVLYPDSDLVRNTASAILRVQRSKERSGFSERSYPPGRFDADRLCREISLSGVDVVLFLGSGDEESRLMAASAKLGWTPTLLLPGSLVSSDIFAAPAAFAGKIYVAFPTLPTDRTGRGAADFVEFARRHALPRSHLAAQIATYCSAKILEEGLARAGRNVSRERLITALEGLYEFDTGLTPRISFGPNRRIGASGAYVVTLDSVKRSFVPAGDWIPFQEGGGQ